MKRYIVIAQNTKMCCVLWLDVENVAQCYYMANHLFISHGWGRPHISLPIAVVEDVEAVQVASNNEEVCRYLNIDQEALPC